MKAFFEIKFLIFFIFLIPLSTSSSLAQTNDSNVYNGSITINGAYSSNSVAFLGKIKGASSSVVEINVSRLISQDKDWAIYYSPSFTPYISYTYPKRDANFEINTTNGFGLSPLGFSILNYSSSFVQPYIKSNGSLIFLRDTFPTDQGTQLNFSFTAVVGLEKRLTDNFALSLGYQFHHISNAETGSENPGIDSNFLFLSFSILN